MTDHYFPCGHKIVLGHTCPVCVNAALLAALRAVEWGLLCWVHEKDCRHCPSCLMVQSIGTHAPDCDIAAALATAEEVPA